ncbi:MAG: hypothetical protein H6649_02305 [Caldilineae bacterium]|nr:hypothetical protein [Caldilineae bacterium]
MSDLTTNDDSWHTIWRKEMAADVARAYAADSDVSAVVLAGSVARGWADQHSDIELDVYWRRPPRDAQRRAALARAGAVVHVDWATPPDEAAFRALLIQQRGQLSQIWPYEDFEWSEHFYVDGVNIGVSAFLAETLEQWIDDVVEHCDIDDDKHMRLAAMQQAVPLYGADLVAGWQARIHYPGALARAVVDQLMGVQDRWWDAGYLAARDAFIPRADLLARMERWLLRLLLALNRIFLPDPRFKWAGRLIDQMSVKPERLGERLSEVFRAAPTDAVVTVRTLANETLDLIDLHLPGCDTDFARAWLSYRRSTPPRPEPTLTHPLTPTPTPFPDE